MKKSKIFMIIGICVLCISIIGSSVAYYQAVLFEDLNVDTITHGLDYYIEYKKGTNIIGATLVPTNEYTEGESTEVELWKIDNTYDIYGHIYLDIKDIGTNLANSTALKYILVNNDSIIAEGTLNGTSTNESILVKANIPLATTKQLYKIYIWLDENEEIDLNIENDSLALTVRCEATMKPITAPMNLISHIKDLYRTNYDSTKNIAFADGTGMNYYAPSVRLMNDGLNSSGNMIDATTAVNGIAGNIRYYGVDDSNLKNYIYFNCSDYSNQTSDTCETWRIIGIVDGKIKIIRNNKIEDLAWDYDKNTDLALESSSNNWENSSLQILLNQSYYNGDTSGEITYYSKRNGWPSDEEVETVLDMNNIGIKNSETRNLISNSIWYLGGYNQIHSIYANDIYTYERTDSEGTTLYSGNPFSLERNIGIMYASDYSYASDLNLCKEVIDAYSSDTTNCTGTNWLYNGDNEWTITQNPGGTNYAVISISIGNINNNGGGGDNAYILRAIRPTIYLISELNINKLRGDGSINDPYNIVV